jgi:hypothetical protein
MVERGRWRCPEKEDIVGGGVEPNLSAGMILLFCDMPRRKLVHAIYISAACPASQEGRRKKQQGLAACANTGFA